MLKNVPIFGYFCVSIVLGAITDKVINNFNISWVNILAMTVSTTAYDLFRLEINNINHTAQK